jgi:putative transcriptional regulator
MRLHGPALRGDCDDRRFPPRRLRGKILGRLERFSQAVEALPAGAPLASRFTVRTVKLNLAPPVCSPSEVKATRELLGTSQAIFAQFLGVSPSAAQDWEQGHKPPRGSACRLMHEIRRDPACWRKRLAE